MAFDIAAFKTTDPLGDLAIRMANARTDFIATEVFPVKTVPKAQFKWYQYDKSNLRSVVTEKPSKAEADKIAYGVFGPTGQAILHKLAADIDPADERDADAVVADLDTKSAASITEKLLLRMEKLAYTLLATAANYPAALTTGLTTGTTTWADSGGDPIQVAKDAKAAVRLQSGRIPQRLAASYEVVEALRIHPQLIDRLKYTGTSLPDALIAQLLGVRDIVVATAIENTAREGAADVLASIWQDIALFYWFDAADGTEAMTYGRTFMVEDVYTHRYIDEKRGGPKGRIKVVEMGWEYVHQIVARQSSTDADTTCGYLVTNAI